MPIADCDLLKNSDQLFCPDVRVTFWGDTHKSLEDFYVAIKKLKLADAVPEDVVIQFETAKNVLLYSFYSYRMSSAAKLFAYAAFERALGEKIEVNVEGWNLDEKKKKTILNTGLRKKLEIALEHEWLNKNDFFYIREVEGSRDQELLDFVYNYFVDFRNELAHKPKSLDILWHVPEKLAVFVHLINKLYEKKDGER